MLFKPEHVEPILQGRKIQTRRIWKRPRAKTGSIHKAKTKLFSKDYFAQDKITAVRKERLGDISIEDVRREGYETLEEFKAAWVEINGSWDSNAEVFVVSFEMVEPAGQLVLRDSAKTEIVEP